MSTDTDTFEHDLAARLTAAADPVTAGGVTREGIDDRLAARRARRRNRQGGIVLAAAALVIAAGIGALAIGADEPEGSVQAGPGRTTTAVPTTDAPTTEPSTTTTESPLPTSTPTTFTPGSSTTTPPPPSSTGPLSTTTAPPPVTDPPPTTTAPALVPGQPCSPGSSPDCIDPEGDGSYVYLIGGGECMASPIAGGECADLDGDGHAGYPDSQ